MKSSSLLRNFACLSAVALLAIAGMAPFSVCADEWSGLPSTPGQLGSMPGSAPNEQSQPGQQMFASPEDAVRALRTAVDADDRPALDRIFGPDFRSMQTGDKVQDANNTRHFANAMKENCQLDKQSDNEVFVDVGKNGWPMPVPLVETNGQWYFDTAAGKNEIIYRHIGKDELTAIGVCRAYVKAQQQFAAMNEGAFAQKFKSTPGKKDGLYWPASAGEPASPFGALVAESHAEGYGGHHDSGPHAFHGYYFRILTEQGKEAPGGRKNYLSDDKLKNGFALVAYPENWGQSGVMTFIVNQDGKVYQQDLGEKTDRTAARMKEYNPDKNWTLVQDQGIIDAMSDK